MKFFKVLPKEKQFKIDSHFTVFVEGKIDPNCLFLPTVGRSQLFY